MQPVPFLTAVVFLAAVFLASTPGTEAECCYRITTRCGDCKEPDPYCGRGFCNMFGCKCEQGCRKGTCDSKTNDPSDFEGLTNAEAVVVAGDMNGDGLLSIEEAEFLKQDSPGDGNPVNVEDLDTNADGYISLDEINDNLR